MRLLLWSLLLSVGLVVLARPVAAEEKKKELQVLAIASPDAFDNARALTGALRRAVVRSKIWSLAPGEFSLEVMTAALDCPDVPDEPCLQKIAKKAGAQVFIWGFVKKVGAAEVEAHLQLWQHGPSGKETKLRYAANLNDDTDDQLLQLAEKAFTDLVGKPTGTLVIDAGSVDGELTINGELAGLVKKGKAEVEVTAGKLTVLIEAKGYEKLLGTVVVPPGGSATLRLTPVAVQEAGEPEKPEQPTPERPLGMRRTWGWVSVGAGAAALIAGTVFWVQSYSQSKDPTFEAYVNDTPRSQDPCVRARREGASNIVAICDSNVTSRTVSFVMVPLGVALAGLGTYLILSDSGAPSAKSEQAHRVRLRPIVGLGPNEGRFDLRVTF